ncbi:MAG: trypsin-like peptidase domain-containing protein [Coriobacteriales bacterium]|nr:trypsin-like peptidase domain-containing protein [Coriobacteriales bacterium]
MKRPRTALAAFFASIGGVIIGGLLVFTIIFLATDGLDLRKIINEPTPVYQLLAGDTINITPLSDDPTLAEVVAAKALPSVVNIDVYVRASGPSGGTGWKDSTTDSGLIEYSLGSGVVLTENGYILTNYHVIEGGEEFMVRFNQDLQLKAVLVGSDPSSDLAVLKVEATGLIPMDIGDSDNINVGEWVMALGSPFGLEKTVSVGVVSARFRSTTMESLNQTTIYANMIQTDAAINPGNSGGALVNRKGELIGINTLIVSSTESSAGIGFAIPINYAYNIAQQIIAGKTVEHAFLGVKMTTVDPSNAQSLGTTALKGAYVDLVVNGSPADRVGIRIGDVIVRVGDVPVATASEVMLEIRGHLVGDTITIVVVRGGEQVTFDVVLDSDINR